MEKLKSKSWWEAALIRAIRTFCQTLAGMITVGAALEDINWIQIISVSATATILSILTSIATGLPELPIGVETVSTDVKTDEPEEESDTDAEEEE